MKAVVYKEYGSPDVLQFVEIEKPAPRDNEILVKVMAASVNAADWHLLRAKPFLVRIMGMGFLRPKNQVLGADIAGRVESVGKNVSEFKPGDEVFGDVFNCGLGGFAEYACASEDALVLKPANLTFDAAAAVPLAALTALHGLRDKGKVRPGQKVLVNGASGGVGTFAVQLARHFGAEVTAVCSTGNVEMVKSLGADHVIDYRKEDFTKNGQLYDLIFAVNGYHSIFDYKRSLSPGGSYVMSGGTDAQMFQAMLAGPWISMTGSKKMGIVSSKPNKADLTFLKGLLEAGKIVPVIDKRFPLPGVADAIRYLEEGHAKGKVVITQ
jgi:NADPH:quinone reductase-like Zn-dependent oxidoreductase